MDIDSNANFSKLLIPECLRTIDEEMARKLHLKPGQKLCINCLQKEKTDPCEALETVPMDTEDDHPPDDYMPPYSMKESLDSSLVALGCSPLKPTSSTNVAGYAKRKMKQMEKSTRSKVSKVFNLDEKGLEASESPPCEKCRDLENLMDLLKTKCRESTRKEKIKILTLVPSSWTINKTAAEFNVSKSMVKKSRNLIKSHGILADVPEKKGKTLSSEVVLRVKSFYENDEYSRLCPGKKDFVSVKMDHGRQQIQKRLLLVNIKELYAEYKKQFSEDKISFSKFSDLRPKWCVTVGGTGTHYVCVCEIHQNVKLLCFSIPGNLDYINHFWKKLYVILV